MLDFSLAPSKAPGGSSERPAALTSQAEPPTLVVEEPGNKSRTILLHEVPLPGSPSANPPAQAEVPAPQPDLATVRFDLGDLTPVDAAPVALLMASREKSDKHMSPPSTAAALEAPKPRTEASAKRGGVALRRPSWVLRALDDASSALRLLLESAKLYGQQVRVFAALMAIVLMPLLATKSCLVATSTGSAGAISTTMDLSQVKEDLTRKAIVDSSQGKVDKAALAELAALQAVAAENAGHAKAEESSDFVQTARWIGALLLTGVLLLGLALPLGHGAVLMLLAEHTASGRWLGLSEILNRLWRRRSPLGASLLPAALITAVGSVLLLPGVLAAAFFLFVPAIAIFERSSGKVAFLRSLRLVRADGVRVLAVVLVALLVGALAYLLAGTLLPEGSRRIHIFLRLLVGDGLMIAAFPVFALTVARLYIEARIREGETAATLAKASRR